MVGASFESDAAATDFLIFRGAQRTLEDAPLQRLTVRTAKGSSLFCNLRPVRWMVRDEEGNYSMLAFLS
jgi:hypothetical protein